jgi:hypothetical protein
MKNQGNGISGEMFTFVTIMQAKGYIIRLITNSENEIKSLFFTHENAVKDARLMPESAIIDATFKTNTHKLTFVNVVGTSSIAAANRSQLQTFAIAGAWLSDEKGDSYDWVLQELRESIWPTGYNLELPNVFVTDDERALRNAIVKHFPERNHLLCYWHLANSFEVEWKKHLVKNSNITLTKKKVVLETAREMFNKIALASSQEKMDDAIADLSDYFSTKPTFVDNGKTCLDHLRRYLLSYNKRRFLSIYDNLILYISSEHRKIDQEGFHWLGTYASRYMHFGNRTSNRAEGAHSALKNDLSVSSGNRRTVTEKMDRYYRKKVTYCFHISDAI